MVINGVVPENIRWFESERFLDFDVEIMLNRWINVSIEGDTEELAIEDGLARFTELFDKIDKVKRLVAQAIEPSYTQDRPVTGNPKLTIPDIMDIVWLDKIEFFDNGTMSLYFADGGMFDGREITAEFKKNYRLDYVEIEESDDFDDE